MYGYGTQDQGADSNINLNPVPQNYEPIVPPNMPGVQNNEYQPQPQTQTQPEQNNYENQYDYNNQNQYPPQQDNNNAYQQSDMNNQNVQNPFEGMDYMQQPQQDNIPRDWTK